MLKADELRLANDGQGCLGRAAEDEPVFVLRAQDLVAAEAIRFWADEVERRHSRQGTSTLKVKEKIVEARRLALAMDKWPTRHLPD